jgi:hypothetical protein
MELLETQDPEKKRLIESSDRHKRAMEKELGDLTMKTDKVIKNALIVGGSLALTFLVISAISQGRKKKKRKLAKAASAATTSVGGEPVAPAPEEEEEDDEPSVLNKVGTQLLNQASLILLDLARQKLNEYLIARKKTDEHS